MSRLLGRDRRLRLWSGSGGLFLGFLERDGIAERFELSPESAGAVFGRVALALPVGSELAERDLVANDVVVGDEQVVANGTDRLGLTAPAAQLGVVGGEIRALGADRGARALGELLGEPARAVACPPGAPATG